MGTTQKVVGTSLEVLAPYLPYGIEVEYTGWKGDIFRGRVTRLSTGHAHLVDRHGVGFGNAIALTEVRPLLRPFSHLVEPLPDGTIPAVEVARLVMQANRPEGRTGISSYRSPMLRFGGEVISVDCYRATSYTLELLIDLTWAVCTVYDFGTVYAHNQSAIIDYLRAKHFALPINGRPLVEGVDYIAKTAPAPTPSTIQQKGGGDE